MSEKVGKSSELFVQLFSSFIEFYLDGREKRSHYLAFTTAEVRLR